MIVQQELQKLIKNLKERETSHVFLGGSEIEVRVIDEGARISLITSVYSGGNYLPASVRSAIQKRPPFSSSVIRTDLFLNEEKFEVFLRFIGMTDGWDVDHLKIIFEEFIWLADEWRLLLEEQDRNDRVRIPVL